VQSNDSSLKTSTAAIPGAAPGASPAELAEDVVVAWKQADAALSPVLGQQGVAALYQRSLQLAAEAYPWLAEARGAAMDLEALRQVVAGQDSAGAEAGGGALLEAFNAMLGNLVGPFLTSQLLLGVRNNPSSALAQDDPP